MKGVLATKYNHTLKQAVTHPTVEQVLHNQIVEYRFGQQIGCIIYKMLHN